MYTVKVTYHKNGRVGTVSFCNNAKNREEALAWLRTSLSALTRTGAVLASTTLYRSVLLMAVILWFL